MFLLSACCHDYYNVVVAVTQNLMSYCLPIMRCKIDICICFHTSVLICIAKNILEISVLICIIEFQFIFLVLICIPRFPNLL
jgi:hypothetical protein